MKDKKILVDTGIGTKTVNKGEFVDRWLKHFKQIALIVDHSDSDQVLRYADCEMFVEEIAKENFEETYKIQNKKEAV